MGTVTRGLNAHYMKGGAYYTVTSSNNIMFSYTNTSDFRETISSVQMKMGTGNGAFTSGDYVTGTGIPYYYYLTVNDVNTGSVYVTKITTPDSTGTANINEMEYYTFTISSSLTVSAGSKLDFYFQPCQRNLATNLCVCFDNHAEDVIVNASRDSYTVTFDLAGGTRTGGGALVQQVEAGGSATAPTCTRSGYEFVGWDKSFNYITEDTYVTAIWKGNNYTITYDANGGTGAPPSGTKEYDVPYVLSTVTPTGQSYTITFDANGGTCSETKRIVSQVFLYWCTGPNDVGDAYLPGDTYTKNADLYLYAIYRQPTIGTLPIPTNGDSEFYGWYTERTGGYQVDAGNKVYSDLTLYARWECCVYYYYNTTGGDDGADLGLYRSEYKNTGQTYYIITDVPVVTGKKFINWNTSPDGSGTTYVGGQAYNDETSLTLYAQWDDSLTVIFDANGGSFYAGTSREVKTITYTDVPYGGSAGPPSENPTYGKREFLGWIGNYTNVITDVTILALWKKYPIWIENSDHEWEGYGA